MPGYPIPAGEVRVETVVVNSRFVCVLGEARTAAAAHDFIKRIKAEYPDASAHAYAFRAGHGASVTEGCNDGGEPSGTAGKPMLAVLRGTDLGDVVAVVVRYFGGTKLGTGGLVRAFSGALKAGLEALPRAQRITRIGGRCALPYALYERVRLLVAARGGAIVAEDFGAEVTLDVLFPEDATAGFEAAMRELSGGVVVVAWGP
jgi:uncharacterized YigZ family protein